MWDEALLDAIRRDVPAPTVHARNLFHTSAAMWDAWAAYDPGADGLLRRREARGRTTSRPRARRRSATRPTASSCYRYSLAAGLQETFDELTSTMESLCYRIDYIDTEGDSPAALGNRIAAAVIAYGTRRRRRSSSSATSTRPTSPPTRRSSSSEPGADDARSEPLAAARARADRRAERPADPRQGAAFVGPHWGHVRAFALPPSADGPADRPRARRRSSGTATDEEFKQTAVDVIRYSSELDPDDGVTIDIGPGALGDNTLGTNDGNGHDVNPVTGQAYAPNVVPRGDFDRVARRVLGRRPEVGDAARPLEHDRERGLGLAGLRAPDRRHGPEVDRLEWDVKLYFALNGAVHDAAVAAWGAKGYYDSARPISMIRYMGGKGQSSDPERPAYDPDGLPLVPGSSRSSRQRRARRASGTQELADHVGEIAIRAWRGNPEDPATRHARRGLDPRGRLGAVPAADVRHAGVRRLRLGPQHVQPRGRRGDDRRSRADPYFPGGLCRVDACPPARSRSSTARARTSRCSGRRTTTPPTTPGISRLFGGHPHLPRRLRGPADRIASAARPPGASPSGTSRDEVA